MASPAQLVQTISSVTGIPLPAVVDVDRKLVTANLRSKGGRGFNAARMTALDAARLLVAVLGSAQSNAAADTVTRYSLTAADKKRSSQKLFAAALIDDLAALPARHSFVDAVAALIASVATGSLASTAGDANTPSIEVFAFTKATRGRIRISGLPNGLTASVEYAASALRAKDPPMRKPARTLYAVTNERTGDIERSSRVTERTIFAIATLLAKGRPT
jgi:hypothetical protein